MYNPMDLTGKRILVTGASSGIGQACAQMISRLGGQVVLVGRDESRLVETRNCLDGDGHLVLPHELSDLDGMEKLFTTACADGRKLNGLVHAAGVSASMPLSLTSPELVERILTINFKAFLFLCKHYAKKKFGDGGSIVGLSSVAAMSGQPSLSIYCGSKSALDAAAAALALELIPKRIRVNTVLPSYIRTPMVSEAEKSLPPESFQRIVDSHPMGMGEPEDVAHAVAFLLSDAAKYITGTHLVVDGGYLA